MKREQMPAHRVSQCTLAVCCAEMFVQQFMHSDGTGEILKCRNQSLAGCLPPMHHHDTAYTSGAIRISFVTQRIPVMTMRLIKIL